MVKGMNRVYTRAVEYVHTQSEVPSFVAATVTSIWERVWGEVRRELLMMWHCR